VILWLRKVVKKRGVRRRLDRGREWHELVLHTLRRVVVDFVFKSSSLGRLVKV